jgi:hypothetical protein
LRLLPFLSLVGILAATIVFSLMLSERGLILSDRPVVAHLGTIGQPPDFDLGKMLDD